MKKVVIIGAGVAGVLGWYYWKSKQSHALQSPAASGHVSQSPGVQYPFSVPQAPRMDNQNQPWTQAPRPYAGNSGVGGSGLSPGDLSSGLSSLSDLWGSLTAPDGSGSDAAQSTYDTASAQSEMDAAGSGDAYDPANDGGFGLDPVDYSASTMDNFDYTG